MCFLGSEPASFVNELDISFWSSTCRHLKYGDLHRPSPFPVYLVHFTVPLECS